MNTTTSEERWLTFPMADKLELLAQCEKLETLMEKQIMLRRELKQCLMHKWMSHDQSQPSSIAFTPKLFKKLVYRYHAAILGDVDRFEMDGHQFLTAYAKYLIEYLEPRMVAMDTSTFGLTHELKRMRREHEIRMKIKTDPNYEPPPSFRR